MSKITLADLDRQITSATQDMVAWQTTLRAAAVNSITAEDVQAMTQKQIDKAKAGDPAALKFVFGTLLGGSSPVQIKQTNIVTDPETAAKIARGM